VIARNAVSANPYQWIKDRNLFRLIPPPEDQKPVPPQPPKITLTGITTILGKKLVLINVLPKAKPGEQAKPQSLILTVGQREAEIEVLEIDEQIDGGTVKLVNHGVIQVLSMQSDGARLGSSVPTPLR